MKNKIKFVYFDVGGVLLDWKKSLGEVGKKFGKTYEEMLAAFRKFDLEFYRGKHTHEEIWKIYHDELGLKDSYDFNMLMYTHDFMIPHKVTHDLVAVLSKKFKVGILTNVMDDFFELHLAKGHIPNIKYHAVVKSCEIGFVKPEPEIYNIAQKAAGVKHHEIFFIDDLSENVKAAEKLGWKTHLFDEHDLKKSVEEIQKKLAIK